MNELDQRPCACHYCNEAAPVAPFRHYYPEETEGGSDRATFVAAAVGAMWLEATLSWVEGEGYAATVWVWSGAASDGSFQQGDRLGNAASGALETEADAGEFVRELARELSARYAVIRLAP